MCLMTDKTLSQLPPVAAVLDSLTKHGVKYKIYEDVRVEPTDKRLKKKKVKENVLIFSRFC